MASASQNTCKNNDLSMIHIGSPHLALKIVAWRNPKRLKNKEDKEVSVEVSLRHILFQSASTVSEHMHSHDAPSVVTSCVPSPHQPGWFIHLLNLGI